jgi:CubicO group peptidase (beta-lactamase class C family)
MWPRLITLLLRLALAVALVGLVPFSSPAVRAQPPGTPARVQTRLEPATVEELFDALIPTQIATRHIPGATVAVVADGQLIFARGYGQANLAQQTPVDPERTLFHIGSNGKLFTWTAVMQLVEQGRLDLAADVNRYLDFRIPATYSDPITLEHLMTHTAGFENRDFDWLAPSPEGVAPLGSWLAANLPTRVRPPGQEVGYSNYGAALAGYIVERLSGLPYEEYVERHLLAPLNMERSTVRQRVPTSLAPDVARGYVFDGNGFREEPLFTYQGTPAGTIRATATDVARFMLAHLQDGRAGNARILQETTAREMRQTLFRPDPRVNGLAYGFLELDRNGERIVGHLGSAAPVHYSLLALLPERGVGFFVAYNADTARPLTVGNEILAAFVDHFYPAPDATALTPPAGFANHADQYVGDYQRNNFGGSYTTVEKLGRLLSAPTNRHIANAHDGTLEVSSRLFGTTHFAEIAPDLFADVGGQERLLFRRDQEGRVTKAIFDSEPEYTFERLPLAETPLLNEVLLLLCVMLFGSTLLAAALDQLVRRRRRQNASGFERLARGMALATSALSLLFLSGLVVVFGDSAALAGDYTLLRAVLTLPLLGTILGAATIGCAGLAWRRHCWGLAARLHYTTIALAVVGFTWFCATWNLLGWRL